MKKEDMLRAMGDVDDRFVEEASVAPVKKSTFVLIKNNWQRVASGIAAMLAVCVIAGFGLGGGSGLGLAKKEAVQAAPDYAYDGEYKGNGFYAPGKDYYNGDMPMEPGESYEKGDLSAPELTTLNGALHNLKLIYKANIDLQTMEFDEAEAALKDLFKGFGAYVESSNVNNGSYYADSYRKTGSYTVRVPAENFEAMLSSMGELCHVTNLSRSVQDVGESYFELESRIQTLRNKEERLQALLKEAKSMGEIIELESALSDTQYQLDRYVSNLNHYDSLIGYSTINVTLTSVKTITPSQDEMSFFQRLGKAIKDGAEDFADGLGDFFIGISYNIFNIVLILAIIFVVWKFRLISRLFGLIFRKK